MKYPDGQEVRLWDQVKLGADDRGLVVCSIDTGEYSEPHTQAQWGYLGKGVLIEFPQYGLIHFEAPDDELQLLCRGLSASVFAFIRDRIDNHTDITADTSLLHDLQLNGDDAWDFLVAFVREFNIDGQSLHFNAHFNGEGFGLSNTKHLKPLTVHDLINAAQDRRFDIYTPDEVARFVSQRNRPWTTAARYVRRLFGRGS